MRSAKTIMGWSIVLVLCICIITGCQIFGHALDPKKISTKRLLLIPRQGSLHLRWEATHLAIEFKGKVSQNLLTTNGSIDITGNGTRRLSMLTRLVVDIYFTDSIGNVLDKQTFYSVDNSPVNKKIPRTFKRSFKLPKKTSHIAFGYDGTVLAGDSKSLKKKENAMEHRFQHSPFK